MNPSQEPYLKNLAAAGIKVDLMQVNDLINELYGEKYPISGSNIKHKQKDRNLQNQREAASKIQKYYQDYINDENNGKVKLQAIDSYQQFLRAYMTCRKELGFIAKDLHFGHLAKTFGLIDPPRELVKKVRDLNWVKNGPKRPEKGDREAPNTKKEEEKDEPEERAHESKKSKQKSHENSKLHFPEFEKKKHIIEKVSVYQKKKDQNTNLLDKEGQIVKKTQKTITIDNEVRRARAQKQMNRARIVERSGADEFDSGMGKKAKLNFAGKSNMAKRK